MRIVLAIVAVIASFMLVDSLTCNKCSFGLLGVCLNSGEENCATNSSVCFTGRATFSQLSDFRGFNTQGCIENSTACDTTTNGTLLGITYQSTIACCNTNNCNPIDLSGAPSTKMTLTTAVAAALLASVVGSMQ